MTRLTFLIGLTACAACTRQSSVQGPIVVDSRSANVLDEDGYVAKDLPANFFSENLEVGAPPEHWKKDVGKQISFVGLFKPFSKGRDDRNVYVGKHLIEIRGGLIPKLPHDTRVRVTGVLQLISHPGDPTHSGQQGAISFGHKPWKEWFVDVTKFEVLAAPPE